MSRLRPPDRLPQNHAVDQRRAGLRRSDLRSGGVSLGSRGTASQLWPRYGRTLLGNAVNALTRPAPNHKYRRAMRPQGVASVLFKETDVMMPTRRPANPCFSSGPCAKRPGWSSAVLEGALLGRSHRSKAGLAKLVEVIERSKRVLEMPADWRLGIVAGSDTGAVEMALWSLLGARGVDLLCWENFGEGWVADVTRQLKPADVRVLQASYGELPDLAGVDPDRDTVFVWNGTTSGVRVPNGDWIAGDRR